MIHSCDRATVHVVDDAYVDMLTNSAGFVKRHGLNHHFMPGNKPVKADGGISLVVDVYNGDRHKRILIDGGYCGDIVLYNMEIMGIDPASIDMAILSHGHPDHLSGLAEVLLAVGHSVPLYLHPDAFVPRSITQPDGYVLDYINRELHVQVLEQAGARIVPLRDPLELAPGFLYSGEVERPDGFEREVPKGRVCIREGRLADDDITDDICLALNIRDKGLFVIAMCGHSGIITTVEHCRRLTGIDRVYGVLGGFHLGHAGVSESKLNTTVTELNKLDLQIVVPLHCSGMTIRSKIAEQIPQAYVAAGAATSLEL